MAHPAIDVSVISAVCALVLRDVVQWVRLRKNGVGPDIRISLAKLDTKMDAVLDRLGRQEERLDRVIEDKKHA